MKQTLRLLPVLAGAVAGAIVALAISGGSGNGTSSHTTTTVLQPAASSLPTALHSPAGAIDINGIYRKAGPGVVDIQVTSVASSGGGGAFGIPGLGGGQPTQQGEGSGVVYDTKGDILTDEHVVAGAVKVAVKLADGKTYPAKVLGTDASDDVGVIKVNAPASELHPIPLADSGAVKVGDPVVAIGSPFSLPGTVTQGIVSATGRDIPAPNGYTIPGAIQTDAAINPGNSGGPLLDAAGRVIGLSDQIRTNNTTVSGQGSSSGIGFAVPSATVAKIADAIISGHPVQHPFVGVQLTSGSENGAQVSQVEAGSPAVTAGLEPGDVITKVNGTAISSTESFITTIGGYAPGQTVTLTVQRQGQTRTLKLKLGVRPVNTPQTG